MQGEEHFEESRVYRDGAPEITHRDTYVERLLYEAHPDGDGRLRLVKKRTKTGQVIFKIVRLFQLHAVHSWLTGNHTVLPAGTGSGKSMVSAICLTYAQLTAPNKEKAFSWHVYPTIVLMQEQEQTMSKYFKVAAYDPASEEAAATKVHACHTTRQ